MDIIVRPFSTGDVADVRALFIRINRLLAPPALADAFERYIVTSLEEEIDRIADYYAEKQGGFWVATGDAKLVGMFGLELQPTGDAMELRRMYVDPDIRRQGVARKMLQFAEAECRRRLVHRLDLSTSELQREALSLYRSSGFQLVREEVAEDASNKTLGGGIRRYHFTKLF
jgi:putative acetyltransferase